jgi:hypothetical protein
MAWFSVSGADPVRIFGPTQFSRATAPPQDVTRTFQNCAPSAEYKLVVLNGNVDGTSRVSSGSLAINGTEILRPSDFNQHFARMERPIRISASNQIQVRLRSSPGSFITVTIECSAKCPSGPLATSDAMSVTFRTASCQIVSSIPLQNSQTVSPTPSGDVTTITRQKAVVTDDGTHVGIYSIAMQTSPGGQEGTGSGVFQYFGGTGQLWQVTAPFDYGFVAPLVGRVIAADGSRVLLIQATGGGSDPTFFVYDQSGRLLYATSAHTFSEFYTAQLSSTGRYFAVSGALTSPSTDDVRVTDVDAGRSWDITYDSAVNTVVVAPSGDGRFSISVDGVITSLPPSP